MEIAKSKTHRSNTFLAVVAQLFQHGASVMILPVIIFSFSPEVLGLWYIVVSFQSGIFLLDMGLMNSFSRSIAQAFSGVKSLKAVGWFSPESDQPNYALIKHIVKQMIFIYLVIAIASFIFMFFGGIAYMSYLDITEVNNDQIIKICFLAAIAIAIQFFGQWITASLIGSGLTHHNQISILISRLIFLLYGLFLINIGWGIVGLLFANSLGNLIGFIYKYFAYTKFFPKPNMNVHQVAEPVLRIIWHNAWRIGLVGFCAFFILRFGVLLLGYFEGLTAAGILGLLIQISTIIIAASSMPWQVGMRSLVNLKIAKDVIPLRKFAATNWSYSFFIAFSALFLLIGLEFSGIFIGTQFEGLIFTKLFFLFANIMLLELNHTIAAQYISASNYIPFLPASIISAILIVLFSTVFVMQGWGIFGIVISQGFVQLLWNNWFWPYKVWSELYADS